MTTVSPLVSTRWLSEQIGNPGLTVIDATWFMPGGSRDARDEFATRHIPGAVFFGIDEICDRTSDLPHMMTSPAAFATAARRLGVNDDSVVVVYDAHGLFSAPRVWWNFRAMGHERTFVLDGGLPRWIDEGRVVEGGWPTPPHGDFRSRPDFRLARDLAAMRRAVDTHAEQIVDARPSDRFRGIEPEPRANLRRGHMPGAINAPWSDFVVEGMLAPSARIAATMQAAGVDTASPIVATCGSGVSAALLALALARIGRDDVAVYDGAWAEWASREDTPVVGGEA
jgi:thiosulfate/3-mercaptopyruvate sulfurtransferase